MPTFNALTGPELKDVILKAVSDEIDLSGEFKAHVTFPWVKFTFKLDVLSYPKQGLNDEPEIKVVTTGESNTPASDVPVPIITIDKEVIIDTPDQARADAKLPIPVAGIGIGGVVVDKPVLPLKKVK